MIKSNFMRHRKKKKKYLTKKSKEYNNLRNLAGSLILNGQITTTKAKASALISFLSPLVERAKSNNLVVRNYLSSEFNNKKVINKLLTEIAPQYKEREGGYFQYTLIKYRHGDNAPLVKVNFL